MNEMIPFEKLAANWRKDPDFMREYGAMEEEFALAAALIGARAKAGLTQAELAERMGTTLAKGAKATGTRLR